MMPDAERGTRRRPASIERTEADRWDRFWDVTARIAVNTYEPQTQEGTTWGLRAATRSENWHGDGMTSNKQSPLTLKSAGQRRLHLVAGAGFEPATSGLAATRCLSARPYRQLL